MTAPQTFLIGRGRSMQAVPFATLEQHLAQLPAHSHERIGWMSADHRRVRESVVRELPHSGVPLASQTMPPR